MPPRLSSQSDFLHEILNFTNDTKTLLKNEHGWML